MIDADTLEARVAAALAHMATCADCQAWMARRLSEGTPE